MNQFPTAEHLASWAGMCPGNNESAGKRKSGKTTKGSRWLRQMLTQAAWAASHTKNTYLSAQYRRLAARRGKKRALVALGHTLLIIMYHLLKERTTYQELGGDFLERSGTQPADTAVGQTAGEVGSYCHPATQRGRSLTNYFQGRCVPFVFPLASAAFRRVGARTS